MSGLSMRLRDDILATFNNFDDMIYGNVILEGEKNTKKPFSTWSNLTSPGANCFVSVSTAKEFVSIAPSFNSFRTEDKLALVFVRGVQTVQELDVCKFRILETIFYTVKNAVEIGILMVNGTTEG